MLHRVRIDAGLIGVQHAAGRPVGTRRRLAGRRSPANRTRPSLGGTAPARRRGRTAENAARRNSPASPKHGSAPLVQLDQNLHGLRSVRRAARRCEASRGRCRAIPLDAAHVASQVLSQTGDVVFPIDGQCQSPAIQAGPAIHDAACNVQLSTKSTHRTIGRFDAVEVQQVPVERVALAMHRDCSEILGQYFRDRLFASAGRHKTLK